MDYAIYQDKESFTEAFFSRLPSEEKMAALGDTLEELEIALIEKTESLLEPQIGAWDETKEWWHQMDFFGDGKRELAFSRSVFNPSFVSELQALLTGPFKIFAFFIQVPETMEEWGNNKYGEVGIFNNQVIATKAFINEFGEKA
ncbi:MAG: hypothetical protein PVG66_05120 [Chromatiales bacterium]|jgi:hypothetical protein